MQSYFCHQLVTIWTSVEMYFDYNLHRHCPGPGRMWQVDSAETKDVDMIGGISGLTVSCLRKTHKMAIEALDYFFYNELI